MANPRFLLKIVGAECKHATGFLRWRGAARHSAGSANIASRELGPALRRRPSRQPEALRLRLRSPRASTRAGFARTICGASDVLFCGRSPFTAEATCRRSREQETREPEHLAPTGENQGPLRRRSPFFVASIEPRPTDAGCACEASRVAL